MPRPKFEEIKTGSEFNRWYWLKEEMVDICKRAGLPTNGRKFDLRDRIMFALDNGGKVFAGSKKQKKTSKFDWAKAELSLETVITDNVAFGPNFRRSCHSDFMDWVKSNVGKQLSDAADQWRALEKRKENPNFKRVIAANNMLAQYTRDFLADNKNKTLKDATRYWELKKQLPTKDGFVRYQRSDLELE